MSSRALEVVFKIVERCNIACSYCYFFRSGDNSYEQHPARIANRTIEEVGRYLADGAAELNLGKICIDFHGGEPLLLGLERFDSMCRVLRSAVESHTALDLRCQTNGTLINEDWISLFATHNVHVGVSLDGPQDYHDEHRRGFDGKGSYTSVINGVATLRSAVKTGTLPAFGILCVIQPDRSAHRILRHFVEDLGIDRMDFLLPDNTHQKSDNFPIELYGKFLCDLLDAWSEFAEESVRVRILDSVIALLLGGESKVMGFKRQPHHVITISSNGLVGPDDTLRSCNSAMMDTGYDVFGSTLSQYLSSDPYRQVADAINSSPANCQNCHWNDICGGGSLVNRYHERNNFDNPSVYCAALKEFYAFTAAYLIKSGLTEEELVNNIFRSAVSTSFKE